MCPICDNIQVSRLARLFLLMFRVLPVFSAKLDRSTDLPPRVYARVCHSSVCRSYGVIV